MKISILLLSLFTIPLIVKSQGELVKLSLKEALSLSIKNSKHIQLAKEKYNISKADYAKSKSMFLPDINLTHTGIITNDPLSAFGFKLKQEITSTDDFNPILLNNPGTSRNFQTQININQAIINIDALHMRKAEKYDLQANSFMLKRSKYSIYYQIRQIYFMHALLSKSIALLKQSLIVSEENIRISENNYKQGFIRKSDVLLSEVYNLDLKSELIEIQSKQAKINDIIVYNLGLDQTSIIQTTDSLIHDKIILIDNNLLSRSDIMASKQYVLANKEILSSNKMSFLPRLNAFASYQFNDKKIFGVKANNYMIGASLSWDVFSGNKKFANIKKSKARLKISNINYTKLIQESNIELKDAKRNIHVSYSKINLNKLALQQASEALIIMSNRYKLGMETTKDLLEAELKKTSQSLKYQESLYKYNVSIFYFEYLSEHDLE